MVYGARGEQERVEDVARRIEVNVSGLTEDKGNYEGCRVVETAGFAEAFGDEASDIMALVAMYLYEQGDEAPVKERFIFTKKDGGREKFLVMREEGVAIFALE